MGKLEWNSTGEVVTGTGTSTATRATFYFFTSKPSLWRRILRRFGR